MKELGFLRKKSCPKNGQYGPKIRFCGYIEKFLVIKFFSIWSVMKVYIILHKSDI